MDQQNLLMPCFAVSDFIVTVNQILENGFSRVQIKGEIDSFKLSHDKFLFFNIKDDAMLLSCFMMAFKLRSKIKDGDEVIITGSPKVTKFGKLSFVVDEIKVIGDGRIILEREKLLHRLKQEGLFDPLKKQALPKLPIKVGIISSTKAAGYIDFVKIINQRWPGLNLIVKNSIMQGDDASSSIVKAIDYFNQLNSVDLIVIVRGGGSKEDLSCFDDEIIVRAISNSKLPIATGIGHEIDISLADLAADFYAATPSHLAQSIVLDQSEFLLKYQDGIEKLKQQTEQYIVNQQKELERKSQQINDLMLRKIKSVISRLAHYDNNIEAFNPQRVLEKGYAVLRGDLKIGKIIKIETSTHNIQAQIKEMEKKND